jgi:3-methyladenine DNA glycosylase AlkD
MIEQVRRDLKKHANAKTRAVLPRFFKTAAGQYGEGDIFLGVTVPNVRAVSRKYNSLPLKAVEQLLLDPVHEFRLLGLLILVGQYEAGDEKTRERIAKLYLKRIDRVNNWDLVDSSAPQILGRHLFGKDTSLLDELAAPDDLWKQRIAILSTQYFIRQNDFDVTLRIAETLMHHSHDLIHKAVGWMLREVGDRNRKIEERFLKRHYKSMPRTMLRYAIEKFEEPIRQKYLLGKI